MFSEHLPGQFAYSVYQMCKGVTVYDEYLLPKYQVESWHLEEVYVKNNNLLMVIKTRIADLVTA